LRKEGAMGDKFVNGLCRVLGGFSLVGLLVGMAGGPAVQAQVKPIELSYASYIGETALHSEQARLWAKEVEKRTNGRVKVTKWAFGGAICGGAEQIGCIARGLADIGYAAPSYAPAELRLATLTEMVYLSDVPGADIKARVELYDSFPALREEFRAAGLEVLTFHPTAVFMLGVSKRRPVNTSSDLKGIKSHAYGIIADVMTRVGMTPVAIPIGDVYESLSRGVIDGCSAPLWYMVSGKFYEVTGTIVDPGLGTYASPILAMSKTKYDSLPDDVKKVIEELRREQVLPEVKALMALEEETAGRLKKDAPHLKYLRFSEKARAAWREAARPDELVEKLIKDREARSPQAREFYKRYEELVRKYEPEMKQVYRSPLEELQAKTID